jgi:ribulose-5-phosphate 4-epimerase/fuculose-1-phosphate aldolase
MNDIVSLRERVAKACRIIGKLNLTKAATGHISARYGDDSSFLIRARGRDELGVRYTAAEHIILVDRNGKKLDGPDGLSAPQEVFIHSSIYRRRPDVMSVAHIHPVTVMLFTICNKPILPLYGAYDPSSLRLIVTGLSRYPRSILIKNDALGEDLADAMGSSQACLMRGHGVTTVGKSVEEAALTAIKLNEAAEINYQAALLGDPEPISDADIRTFIHDEEQNGPAATSGRRSRADFNQASWRYYATLAGEEA